MKGYYVPTGFMGYVGKDKYMIFSTEQDYYEYIDAITQEGVKGVSNYISKEETKNGSSKEV